MEKERSLPSEPQVDPVSPDEAFWRRSLLAQCEVAVANLDFSTVDFAQATQADSPNLYDFFAELASLRNEQKRGNRKFSEVLGNFTSLLENMRDERDSNAEKIQNEKKISSGKEDRSLALALIDLRDRLDRILTNANDSAMEVKTGFFGKTITPPAWGKHCESLEILSRHFLPVLKVAGLERIQTKGRAYDPAEMKAVSTPAGESLENLCVAREILPGYRWQGQCLRPAEVEIQTGDTSNLSNPIP